MEDKKYTAVEVMLELMKIAQLQYYAKLEKNSGSKLNAIKTCTMISVSLIRKPWGRPKYDVMPEKTLDLAERFSVCYGPKYWDWAPESVPLFEAAVLDPEHADLPEHTKTELKQLNELLTNRLNTPDVDEWSMGEKHQVLSLALSTFDVMAKWNLWKLISNSAQ